MSTTLPSFLRIEDGRDAYLSPIDLTQMRKSREFSRFWSVMGRTSTVQVGKRIYKDASRFGRFGQSEDMFMSMLEDAARHNVNRPSSFASHFHDTFRSPRVTRSVNAIFDDCFVGGWEEAKVIGSATGLHRQYDINSAYLWSGSLGLPDVKSWRAASAINPRFPGLYNITQADVNPSLPYPFNQNLRVNATVDEIDAYNIRVAHVHGGITWGYLSHGQELLDAVMKFEAWKSIGKAYWGRWCSTVPVYCESKNGKVWPTPNMLQNIVWAHVILSRVKMRLYEVSQSSCHVYVDSVITTQELPTSDAIGAWKLETVFPEGVQIKHAGNYGHLNGKWLKFAGEKLAA